MFPDLRIEAVDKNNDNPLIVDILTLMTPSEIQKLSYIYHSLNRVSLTHLMHERLSEEMEEMGYRPLVKPPPLFEGKKWEREDPIPSVISLEEVQGGPGFILSEREKLKRSNQKLHQMNVISIYREITKLESLQKDSKVKSLGLLVNKLAG